MKTNLLIPLIAVAMGAIPALSQDGIASSRTGFGHRVAVDGAPDLRQIRAAATSAGIEAEAISSCGVLMLNSKEQTLALPSATRVCPNPFPTPAGWEEASAGWYSGPDGNWARWTRPAPFADLGRRRVALDTPVGWELPKMTVVIVKDGTLVPGIPGAETPSIPSW